MVKSLEERCLKEEAKIIAKDLFLTPVYAIAGAVLPGTLQEKLAEKTGYQHGQAVITSMVATTVGTPAVIELMNPEYLSAWPLIGIGAAVGLGEALTRAVMLALGSDIRGKGKPDYIPGSMPAEIGALPFRLAGFGLSEYWKHVKERSKETRRKKGE